MKYTRRPLVLLLLPALLGCGGEERTASPPAGPPPAPVSGGARHDPARCGSIRGRVIWSGDLPTVVKEMAGVPTGSGYNWSEVPNPWAPVIDRTSGGLAEAVLSLDGVDPELARPWDLGAVRVEIESRRILVRQGESARRTGIVRAGDEASFLSLDSQHQMLRTRGSAFFTLPFPEPQKPLTRRLDRPGWVELTSGAGYFWHAAELLVAVHPYHAVSRVDGAFDIPGVPAGSYTLVARVRNWRVTGKERDPETGLVFRHLYAAPVELRFPVVVRPREESVATVSIPASAFSTR